MEYGLKTYRYLFVVVVVAFLLSLNTFRAFSLDEMSLFLTVVGLIYGLVVAFTINNAWERFSKIRDCIAAEVNALMSMYIYAVHLSDQDSLRKLKEQLVEYCKEVPTIEWHDYWKSEKTHQKFRGLIKTVASVKLESTKDQEIFDEVSEELRAAAVARYQQLVLAETRISKIQWALNIFLSAILIAGLVLLKIPDFLLSVFIVTSMVSAVIMLLVVLYELDTMKTAEEEVSVEPYKQVVRVVENE